MARLQLVLAVRGEELCFLCVACAPAPAELLCASSRAPPFLPSILPNQQKCLVAPTNPMDRLATTEQYECTFDANACRD